MHISNFLSAIQSISYWIANVRDYGTYNSYAISTHGLLDMYTLSPQASGPWAAGVHIEQTTHVHGITITYVRMYTV